LPEKDDMGLPEKGTKVARKGRGPAGRARAADPTPEVDMTAFNAGARSEFGRAPSPALDPFTARRMARERQRREAGAMRCVSSGYRADGRSCCHAVPSDVAEAAWAHEQGGDRFFLFTWRGEAWLGFGAEGDGVRGVYCPEHHAQRAERSFARLLSSSTADDETLTAA
jgi:hypothetical protein